MKRPISPPAPSSLGEESPKRPRLRDSPDGPDVDESQFGDLDENVLFEILKHADDRTLARCACVSKTWNRTSRDERLWEMVCTPYWGSDERLRSIVIALGGFRLLHTLQWLHMQMLRSFGSGSG